MTLATKYSNYLHTKFNFTVFLFLVPTLIFRLFLRCSRENYTGIIIKITNIVMAYRELCFNIPVSLKEAQAPSPPSYNSY